MLQRKKFSVDFIWNVASLGILSVSGIIINTFIATYAGAEALGLFNQVFSFYIMLSQLSAFGIHLSVLKHVSYNYNDQALVTEIMSSAITLCAFISFVFAFITYVSRGFAGALMSSPDVAFGVGLVAFGFMGFALNKILLFVLNGLSHMRAYAVFQALRYIFIMVGVFIVMGMSLPSKYFAMSLTFAETLLFIVLGGYVFVRVVPFKPASVSTKWCREHITFGARALMSGIFQIATLRIDVLTLGYFLSDKVVGIYSYAAIIAEGIGQLSNVARRNVDPVLGEHFSKRNISQIRESTNKIKYKFFPFMIIVCMASVPLYVLGINILFKDIAFKQSVWVFVILIAGVALNALYRPFSGILLQGGRPGAYSFLTGLLFVINLIGNILLIPVLGVYGAALSTAFVLVLEGVLICIFAKKVLGIKL